jgi:hypothetical protein
LFLAIILKESNAQFGSISSSLRKMIDMPLTVLVRGPRELTGKVRSKNGVRRTLERGQPISIVGDMDMEERNRGDPEDQPRHKQQTLWLEGM